MNQQTSIKRTKSYSSVIRLNLFSAHRLLERLQNKSPWITSVSISPISGWPHVVCSVRRSCKDVMVVMVTDANVCPGPRRGTAESTDEKEEGEEEEGRGWRRRDIRQYGSQPPGASLWCNDRWWWCHQQVTVISNTTSPDSIHKSSDLRVVEWRET